MGQKLKIKATLTYLLSRHLVPMYDTYELFYCNITPDSDYFGLGFFKTVSLKLNFIDVLRFKLSIQFSDFIVDKVLFNCRLRNYSISNFPNTFSSISCHCCWIIHLPINTDVMFRRFEYFSYRCTINSSLVTLTKPQIFFIFVKWKRTIRWHVLS